MGFDLKTLKSFDICTSILPKQNRKKKDEKKKTYTTLTLASCIRFTGKIYTVPMLDQNSREISSYTTTTYIQLFVKLQESTSTHKVPFLHTIPSFTSFYRLASESILPYHQTDKVNRHHSHIQLLTSHSF